MTSLNAANMNDVLNSIKSSLHEANMMGFDSFAEQTVEFFEAVDWTQPWILALIGFHIVCFLIAVGLRNQHNSLSVYFFILLGFAALTQPINLFCIKHWKLFSSESYFDPSGIFVVTVYSFPLICNGFVTLFFILKATVSLLIKSKRAQLKRKINNSSKQSNSNKKKEN